MESRRRIAPLDEVPEDTTLLFSVRDVDTDEEREAVLVRLDEGDGDDRAGAGTGARDDGADSGRESEDGGERSGDAAVAAWFNYCQHFTHITLDKGSGAPMRDGELVCANHGAYFEADSGYCTYGPCEGAYLEELAVTVEDGGVYLSSDGYEFVGTGGIADDGDLTSTSNVEF
jgi:nitrite reductase/ring-hydroxylating ferredoxin subunit